MYKIKMMMVGALTLFLFGLNGVDAWASKAVDSKWSFEFQDVSVKEALAQISQKAGVTFKANEELIEKTMAKKMLHKSYYNKNLDKIIQDIFEKDNCAFTWLYKNNRLNQVEIWIVGGTQEKKMGIKKAGGPGSLNKSAKTGFPSKRAISSFKQSMNKSQRRFKNVKHSTFKQPGRRLKSSRHINPSSFVPDSITDRNSSKNLKSTYTNHSQSSSGNVTSASKIVNLPEIAYDLQSSRSNVKIDSGDLNYPTDNSIIISKTETVGNSGLPSLSNMLPIIAENENLVSMITSVETLPATIIEEEMPDTEKQKDENNNQEGAPNSGLGLPSIGDGMKMPDITKNENDNQETLASEITLPAIVIEDEIPSLDEYENDDQEITPIEKLPNVSK